jgi:ParB-like chromosome segregation protein Spo0J
MKYAAHDAANIFPLDEEHIDELAEDIRKNGLQVPIELLGDKILDGRRRFYACQRADVEPTFREVSIDDPVAYVLSLNLHRRHLTPSQLGMVGARARDLYDKLAKERQKRKPAGSVPANLPEQKTDARDAVGKAVGVSGKTIDHATRVLDKGIPELAKAVDEGRMAVSTAAILATEPPEVQRQNLESGRHNRKYTPGPGGAGKPEKKEPEKEPEPGQSRGVGVRYANEAIDRLKKIPKNDGLRKRGFQIVSDWIRQNK